jgi:probable lipoprotein NlpC
MKSGHLAGHCHSVFYCIVLLTLFSSCVGTGKLARQEKVDIVVARARSYMGTPYKYGGTTSLGMDCSGLLMRSFEAIDVYIPRTAKAQSKLGKRISIHDLQEGDLVFFKTYKGNGRITHAGLVTDARNKNVIMVIHASSSRGVMEVNLMSAYYRKAFRTARRLKL